MSTVKTTLPNTPKRYQNPELFERLAMEYAIGMLHGRARVRFEQLMQRHLYLQATADAYEYKFAGLAEALPEKKPHPRVWKKVKKQSNLKRLARQGTPWWQSLQFKLLGFVASVLLLSSLSFLFFFSAPTVAVETYVSVLKSEAEVPMAMAMLKKEQGIDIQLLDGVEIPDNMELKLWCLPKTIAAKPIMMGTLTKLGHSSIKIDTQDWQGLSNVKALAISLEPVAVTEIKQPTGKLLYMGKLQVVL